MANFAFRSKGASLDPPMGCLDVREKRSRCIKLNTFPISKQMPFRVWMLTALLCAVACVTIVCATIWACNLAGLSNTTHQTTMVQNTQEVTEDMVERILARRIPDSNLHQEPLVYNYDERNRGSNPPNNKDKTPSKRGKISTKNIEPVTKNSEAFILEDGDQYEGIKGRFGLKKEVAQTKINTNDNEQSETDDILFLGKNPPKIIAGISDNGTNENYILNHFKNDSPLGFSGENATLLKRIPSTEEIFERFNITSDIDDPNSKSLNIGREKVDQEIYDNDGYPDSDGESQEWYGSGEYFYSELDAQAYYSDYDYSTWTGFIMDSVQHLHNWISRDFVTRSGISKGNPNSSFPQILASLNLSILKGDASILLLKLKDLYFGQGRETTDQNSIRTRELITNVTDPASFGLLTIDVLLLRNLQLLAWDDEDTAIQEVAKDPEIFAMNALFMDPHEVGTIYEDYKNVQKKDLTSESSPERREGPDVALAPHKGALTSKFYSTAGNGQDLLHFVCSSVRAAANLGRVFRIARAQINSHSERSSSGMEYRKTEVERGEKDRGVTELDCVWIVYCRNLEKAANSSGIYGILAKINSLALRLLIGDSKPEGAVGELLDDIFSGGKHLKCEEIFPKCSKENAPKIVLDGLVNRHSLQNKK